MMNTDQAPPPASHYEFSLNPAAVKQQGLAYMDTVEGWCSKKKGGFLIDLVLKVKPETILEIGVFGGKSLVPMAYALKAMGRGIIYGIDPWTAEAALEEVMNPDSMTWWNEINYEHVMNDLIDKLDLFYLSKHVKLIRSTSEDAPLVGEIDILHIDGNHSDKTTFIDVTKWVPYVKPGGWIILDDMTWFENGEFTTARAAAWLDAHCYRMGEIPNDNCVWGMWRKP